MKVRGNDGFWEPKMKKMTIQLTLGGTLPVRSRQLTGQMTPATHLKDVDRTLPKNRDIWEGENKG